jgi:hypothetical protein
MDRRERRRRKRLEDKLIKKLSVKKSPPPRPGHKEAPTPPSSARRYYAGTLLGAKRLLGLLVFVLTLLGGYALIRPHVSLEPDLLLNPVDPFSTQFSVTNQNLIFTVKSLQPACSTQFVETSHKIRLTGLPPFPSPSIPKLDPGEKTTIACGRWIGGLGAGAGNVLTAYIEIDVSYKQDWWPFTKTERFPFKGMRDSQNGVHWTHRTPAEK